MAGTLAVHAVVGHVTVQVDASALLVQLIAQVGSARQYGLAILTVRVVPCGKGRGDSESRINEGMQQRGVMADRVRERGGDDRERLGRGGEHDLPRQSTPGQPLPHFRRSASGSLGNKWRSTRPQSTVQ